MAYIGREPQIGNFQVCDAISTVNAQAAYTMQVGGVNVSPETANHMLVSLNGILQAPTTSYTVSGSTITFAANLVTGDVINFIQILGSVLDLGVPSDATVSTAKIVDANVTAAKMFSGFANGITMADQWRLSGNITSDSNPVTSNLERVDTAGQGYIGSAMTQSSGVFTFPSTGIYKVEFIGYGVANGSDNILFAIMCTTNNSSYAEIARNFYGVGASQLGTAYCSSLVDVTDTSNVKVSFQVGSLDAGSYAGGDTAKNQTTMTFIRLGDT